MNSIQNAAFVAFKNKSLVQRSDKVGCYHCSKIFDSKEIVQFTDKGETAICPHCNVDSIVTSSDFDLTEDMMKKLNDHWFKHSY